eukprot:scaffold35166_cov73-Cyclotella_meneghiniana.AAC.9
MSTSLTVDRRSSFDSTNSSPSVLALLAINMFRCFSIKESIKSESEETSDVNSIGSNFDCSNFGDAMRQRRL